MRVIAATNRDLKKAVAEKSFREDLYYRLSVFPVHIPPLRERPEDIPLLAKYILDKFAARIARRFDGIDPATMRRLMAYPWPGNVRELQNVLERAAILASGPHAASRRRILASNCSQGRLTRRLPPCKMLSGHHILAVLGQTNWVIEGPRGAAAILGLHPNTLRSRLKKLGASRSAHERS